MDVREKILEILDTNGIWVDADIAEDDIDLREYIVDSFQFISFIVEIEKEFNMEFPEEFLLFDKIASLNGFSNIIKSILSGESFESGNSDELLLDYDPLEDDDYDEDDPYADNLKEGINESYSDELL
jgi:acyl carrier protein